MIALPREMTPGVAGIGRSINRLGTALLGLLVFACSSDPGANGADLAGLPDEATADTAGGDASDTMGMDGSGSDATEADDEVTSTAGAAIGAFQVSLVAPAPATDGSEGTPGYTSILGTVYEGPNPEKVIWQEKAVAGPCRLLTPRNPFCDPTCGSQAACVEDGVCQDYPATLNVGTVNVEGIRTATGETTFALEPVLDNYQWAGAEDLPFPAFAEGDVIRFEADGSNAVPSFVMQTRGIAPLDMTSSEIVLEAGNPIELTWVAPGQAGLATVHVMLDISHHGGTKAMVVCDSDDTGSLTLTAALVDQLLSYGVSGFPTITIDRRAVGSATIAAGRVDLVVYSEVSLAIDIPGLDSCNEDGDCPDGQTCQTDLTCQ